MTIRRIRKLKNRVEKEKIKKHKTEMMSKMIKRSVRDIFSNKLNTTVAVVVVALIIAESHFVTGVRNSNFISVPTQVKAYENSSVVLPCLYNIEPRFIRWFFEDNLLADSRDEEFPPNFKIWSNGSLQVNNVKATDTGDYACEVTTDNGIDAQSHSIEVQYAPTIIGSASGMVEIELGSTFEMVCEARGVPPPIITWTNNGKLLSEPYKHTPRYFFYVSSINMSGPVDCVASNGVGEPAKTGIYLVVLFPPRVKAVKSFVHTKVGLQAILECEVSSAPPAKVYWFHRNAPVYPDSRVTATELDMNSNHTIAYYQSKKKHILTIKNVRESDLGMYECKTENKIGLKSAHIELAGRPMPSTFKKSPIVSSSTTHNLIWTTESFSPIIEYNLKFRQVPSGNIGPDSPGYDTRWKELTIPGEAGEGPLHSIGYNIRGLIAGKVYEAAVASRNRYGWSDISRVVNFHTGAEGHTSVYPRERVQDEYQNVETEYYDEIPQEASIFSKSSATINHKSIAVVTTISFCLLKFCQPVTLT